MEKLGVVPDIIPTAPKEPLEIIYANGVKVDNGNVLSPTKVKSQPNVTWNAEDDAYYTLIMTDPDAPSRKEPKFREWHHWLVGNIPGNDVAKGEVLSEYVGAGPPKDTDLHRYVLLLYKQQGKKTFDEPRLKNNSAKGRENFSTQKFAEKYELSDPIAGNFFQAAYDDYVPELYKQLD